VKNIDYNSPEMEIIMLSQFADVVTVSEGKDDGKTPEVDYGSMWG
jgi:hypothetical protein